jgi:pseudouridine synthase
VFPVGRLDADTEGLLVLTNDGELAQLLTHPSHGVTKTYLAEVDGIPSAGALRALRTGVDLDDGPTAPARARLLQEHGDHAAVELSIHEGRNRQVRRMLDAVGHPVRRLVRTRIGPLHDTRLAPGEWRALDQQEVRGLYEAASGTTPKTEEGGH